MHNKEDAPSIPSSMAVDQDNEDNSPITSEMESKLLNDNIKKPTSILYEGREESELIDGMRDDNYVVVVNCIDVIDKMLQDHNNGDTEATWYDAVDISSVSLQHRYLMEGISSTDTKKRILILLLRPVLLMMILCKSCFYQQC